MLNIERFYWETCAINIFTKKIWAEQERIINKQDVINAYITNKINSSPFQTDNCFGYEYHIQRIAYFMRNYSISNPIKIDTYVPYTNIKIIDGKHRLAAAYLLNKKNIAVIIDT